MGVARCAIDVDVDRRQTAFDYGKVAALKTLNAKRDRPMNFGEREGKTSPAELNEGRLFIPVELRPRS